MAVARTQLRQVHVRITGGTKVAVTQCFRILKVSPVVALIGLHVVAARQVVRRLEMDVLNTRTGDFRVGDTGNKHAFDEIREGRDTIHEDPEMGELAWPSKNAKRD